MLFDERPKSRRADLYDRERELNDLLRGIGRPLVLLLGIRRIGKTSVLRVALSEADVPGIIIDARSLRENYGRRDLYRVFARALSSRLDALMDVLKAVRGVKILGGEVELSWRGRDYLSLADLFDHLNRRRLVIAIDEAQRLRGPMSGEILRALAHAYDYCDNLTFILTGSEVGLLLDFLGLEDPSSPMYGRYAHRIVLERFTREQSLEFLELGFRELGVKPPDLERVVDLLDGIPGWLTFYGNRYARGQGDLEEILEMAVQMALQELRGVVRTKRYALVLKALASGKKGWSQLQRYLEEKEGHTISKSRLSNILRNLRAMSLIENYRFLDPVYRMAALRL